MSDLQDSNDPVSTVWDLALELAAGKANEADLVSFEAQLKAFAEQPWMLDELGSSNLRMVDVIARGEDSDLACYALLHLKNAGADIEGAPSLQDPPPLFSACKAGNPKIAATLLDLGVDVNVRASASSHKLYGGTPLHAIAAGFRSTRKDAYAECFALVLGAGCDVDAKDKRGQRAVDIAMDSGARSNCMELVEAMLAYGVATSGDSVINVRELMKAYSSQAGRPELLAQLTQSELVRVHRAQDALEMIQPLDEPETKQESDLDFAGALVELHRLG